MTIRRKNPRLQGLIGLGAAINWFSANGYFVAIPLNDSQPWDLVVEDGAGTLSRVQVKTTTSRRANGNYAVSLVTAGGNQSFHTRKPFDNTACELLWILTDAGDIYLFPTEVIVAKRALSLCRKYEQFRTTGPQQMVVGEGFEPSKA
jgi:hypothetical protein